MTTVPPSSTDERGPAWDVARLFPAQGAWSVSDYLELTDITSQLVEFTDGCIEVLEMPTQAHQFLVRFFLDALRAFVEPRGLGTVLFAPMRIRIGADKFREPDIVLMLADHDHRRGDDYWVGADLVVEVVSQHPVGRRRDLESKRVDYAEAGISEYWIVDPVEACVRVLTLVDGQYAEHGRFRAGQAATSCLLKGFSIEVTQLLSVGQH